MFQLIYLLSKFPFCLLRLPRYQGVLNQRLPLAVILRSLMSGYGPTQNRLPLFGVVVDKKLHLLFCLLKNP